MKIIIFTRTAFHHTYFINRLQERFDIACVVRESYPEPGKKRLLGGLFKITSKDELFLMDFHKKYSAGFRFHKSLREYLKGPFDVVEEKSGTKYLNVKCGIINSPEFSSFLKDIKPDVVAVLGSSLIKPDVISIPSSAMINLHSGLSPYYRGTWSYGWPIVNGEPEYIGVTVHYVNAGIDTGDIIFQTRPALDEADDLNAIFLKVISEGVELAADAIELFMEKAHIKSYVQPENTGRLYLTKDFNAEAGRACLSNLGGGMIKKYNSDKEAIDSRVALYGYVPPRIFK